MTRRPLRPSFSFDDQQRLIKAMEDVRHLAILCGSASGFGSQRHQRCDAVGKSIDDLAEELTGDRTIFHAKPHGGLGSPPRAD